MKPTIGRIVIYKPTDNDRQELKNHISGQNNEQPELPAIIVAVFGETEDAKVNVKVFVDGFHSGLWRTSISKGDGEGQWNFPVIVK